MPCIVLNMIECQDTDMKYLGILGRAKAPIAYVEYIISEQT